MVATQAAGRYPTRVASASQHRHVHHAQFHAAGGLQLEAAALRAGLATLRMGHCLTAWQAPGLAGRHFKHQPGPFERRTRGQALQREPQRAHIHTRKLTGFDAQGHHSREAFAQGRCFDKLQHAPGQTGFMHGAAPQSDP